MRDEDEPEWILEHAKKQKLNAILQQKSELEARLAKIRDHEDKQKKLFVAGEPRRKRLKGGSENPEDADELAQYLLEDYNSEDENAKTGGVPASDGLSKETSALLQKLGLQPKKKDVEDEDDDDGLKIFYSSRTHSQLTQFVNELRRVTFPPSTKYLSTTVSEPSLETESLAEELKHLTLGSRKNLCINPSVSKLGNATAINERCLELQKPGTAKDRKCSFLPTKETESLTNDFRDHVLAKVRDIEDIAGIGKRLGICPYYASRPTAKRCELITLPYPLLLQRSAREALGLSLKGHVIIIDEAHNLMDTIADMHSSTVSLAQLKRTRAQIGVYLQKFRNRLKGKNRVYVTQVVRVVDSLSGYLEKNGAGPQKDVTLGDLMSGKGVDQINLHKLLRYLQESKLARKIEGYITHSELQQQQQERNSTSARANDTSESKSDASTPVLTHIQTFLQALTNPTAEGRIFCNNTEKDEPYLKYMLLDPSHHFKEIVEEARAVILAGGTMSPMSDYTRHLLAYLPEERIQTLSCGHVIAPENMMALPLSKGPSGLHLEFTFGKRDTDPMITSLGETILELSKRIPDGLVVFFPSYAYLESVVQSWQKKSGTSAGSTILWDRLSAQKRVFRESKESPSVDQTLSEYTQAIDANHGGLLLSVVGGKMSEGINFSDRLGRGVVIVGLPFPNMHSPEWSAKMDYIKKAARERLLAEARAKSPAEKLPDNNAAAEAHAAAAARDFYENACMRAVNQSIGRAIRHREDYAVIVLLDRRFETERIRKKLPGWIQDGLVGGGAERGFEERMRGVSEFFAGKQPA